MFRYACQTLKQLTMLSIIALGFSTGMLYQFEYVCQTDDWHPKFYGFPFVQETETTLPTSMAGYLFLTGFLGNLVFWIILLFSLNLVWNKLFVNKLLNTIFEHPEYKKTFLLWMNICIHLLFLWCWFASIAHYGFIDWEVYVTHNHFNIFNHTTAPICKIH